VTRALNVKGAALLICKHPAKAASFSSLFSYTVQFGTPEPDYY